MNTRLAIHLLQCIIWAYGLQGISTTICQYLHARLAYLLYLCRIYPIKYPHGFVVVIVSVLVGFMHFIYPYMSELLHRNWLTHHCLNQLWQISMIWNQSNLHIKSKLAIFLCRKLSSNAILERSPLLLMILLINSSPLVPHICVSELGHHWFQIMACRLFRAKPLSEPMLDYCQLDL